MKSLLAVEKNLEKGETKMRRKCVGCEVVYDFISEEDFFSSEARDSLNPPVLGVRFLENPFAAEIRGDETKRWQCNRCWWEDWWEI